MTPKARLLKQQRVLTAFAIGFIFPRLRPTIYNKETYKGNHQLTLEQSLALPTFTLVSRALRKRVKNTTDIKTRNNLLSLQNSFTQNGIFENSGLSTAYDYANHVLAPLIEASGKKLNSHRTANKYWIVPYLPKRVLRAFKITCNL